MIAQRRKPPEKHSEQVFSQEHIRGGRCRLMTYIHIVEKNCTVTVPHSLNSANLKRLIP